MINRGVSSVGWRKLQEARKKKKESTQREKALFEGCLNKVHDKSVHGELMQMTTELHREGERLMNNRTMGQLEHYKRKVKDFVSKANRLSYRVKASGFVDSQGDYTTHMIVEKVDTALEDIAKLIMEKETETLKLLEKLDLIKGLLTDLYR